MTVELHHFRRDDAPGLRQLLLDLYTDVYVGDPVGDTAAFGERLDRWCTSPTWECVIGYDGQEAVGYAFGSPLPPDTDWWTRTAPHLSLDWMAETGSRTFTLAELGVRKPWRKTGVARRMHHELLAPRTEARAVLRVLTSRTCLVEHYESWGYAHVPPAPAEGVRKVCAMVLALPIKA
jgi:hypothetical protein